MRFRSLLHFKINKCNYKVGEFAAGVESALDGFATFSGRRTFWTVLIRHISPGISLTIFNRYCAPALQPLK
ncbi:hypothetical protein L596_018679 [Steinernema carpocapsae]|uniref:Uncharacterized protein n=1 Tax=Steinernema carpocapsae TaxID=34508 RepID=A0A4U5N5D0_STECR|nr:hypothetical protein L596_018679 [Steinernema carpocapsae]